MTPQTHADLNGAVLDYDDLCRILMLIDALPHMAEIEVQFHGLDLRVARDAEAPPAP